MPVINTYLGDNVNWVASKNGSNGFNLTFTNGGVAFDISTYTFVLNISRHGFSTNALQLTQASGLTNGGATGILNIVLTEAQASTTLPRDLYFYQLIYTKDSLDYAMIQGNLTLSATANPGDTTSTLTVPVSLVGTPVNVEVSLAGDVDLSTLTALVNTKISKSGVSALTGDTTISHGDAHDLLIGENNNAQVTVGGKFGGRVNIVANSAELRSNGTLALVGGESIFESLTGNGLRYSAEGYVTHARSLTDKGYVDGVIAALIAGAPGALDTLNELSDALGDDANFAATITNLLALKAPLASPDLTGTPTAPTAAPGTNTTQIATTAFVADAIIDEGEV